MGRANRDTVVAVLMLLVWGAFFWASYDIRDMGYESLGAEVWPRIILVVLMTLSLVYLVRSLGKPLKAKAGAQGGAAGAGRAGGVKGWFAVYRNAIWCFLAFGLFLITLPYLGMLIGGILFVFVALSLLGPWDFKSLITHGAIAVLTVGAMWTLFTFGLRVMLPEGEIFSIF